MEKKITFTLECGSVKWVSMDPNDFIEHLKQDGLDLDSANDEIEYTIKIQKIYTDEDIEKMGEFDGF